MKLTYTLLSENEIKINDQVYEIYAKIDGRCRRIRIYFIDNIYVVKSRYVLSYDELNRVFSKNIKAIVNLIKKPVNKEITFFYYNGEKYTFEIDYSLEDKTVDYELLENNKVKFLVYKDLKLTHNEIPFLIEIFYIERIKILLKEPLEEAKNKLQVINKDHLFIDYSSAKSYLGKCQKYKNRITFSTILARFNKEVIRYVVFHEFAHLKEFNHGEDFYKELGRYFNIDDPKLMKNISSKIKSLTLLEDDNYYINRYKK